MTTESTTTDDAATVERTPPTLDETSILGRNKRLLLAALRQAGIAQVTVTYVGMGDSGGVERVEAAVPEGTHFEDLVPVTVHAQRASYNDGTWQTVDVEQSMPIEQALRDFADEIVDWLHGGWENGDGASGSVVFDCASDSVRVEHTAYFTDSDYEETVL